MFAFLGHMHVNYFPNLFTQHYTVRRRVRYGTVRYCDRYSMFAPQPQIYTLLILGSIEFKGQGEGLALAFLFTQAVDRCVFYSMSHCNVH